MQKIHVPSFLADLGVLNISGGREVSFSCPFDGHASGDANPSARMNADTTAWFCHGCKRSGNAVSFVSQLRGVSPVEAIRQINEGEYKTRVVWEEDNFVDELRRVLFVEDEPHPYWFSIPDECVPAWSDPAATHYMKRRGFAVDTLRDYDLLWDSIRSRVCVQMESLSGQCVGLKGRSTVQSPMKYYIYHPAYENTHHVYLLSRIMGGHVIVCEGELDALMMRQMGFDGAVSIGGSHLSEKQLMLILRAGAERVTVFLDDDPAGWAGSLDAGARLEKWVETDVVVDDREGLDPAQMTKEQVDKCLANAKSTIEYYLQEL